jgi:hypothetical protein
MAPEKNTRVNAPVEAERYPNWQFDLEPTFVLPADLTYEEQRRTLVFKALGLLMSTAAQENPAQMPETVSPLFTHNYSFSRLRRLERYMGHTLPIRKHGSEADGNPHRRRDVDDQAIFDVLAELQETNHPVSQLLTSVEAVYGSAIGDVKTLDFIGDIIKLTRESSFKKAVELRVESLKDRSRDDTEQQKRTPGSMKGRPKPVKKLVKSTEPESEAEIKPPSRRGKKKGRANNAALNNKRSIKKKDAHAYKPANNSKTERVSVRLRDIRNSKKRSPIPRN